MKAHSNIQRHKNSICREKHLRIKMSVLLEDNKHFYAHRILRFLSQFYMHKKYRFLLAFQPFILPEYTVLMRVTIFKDDT